MSDGIVSAAEQDIRDRLRAFEAAVEHRAAMRALAADLKVAATIDEAERLVAEMHRVGDEYEAWLRADTMIMQSGSMQSGRIASGNDDVVAQPTDAAAFA